MPRSLVLALCALAVAADVRPRCKNVAFSTPAAVTAGRQPDSLAFANINGDAWPDLIVASEDYNNEPVGGLVVLTGDGNNSWTRTQELVPTHNVEWFVPLDFDGDGDDDVAYFQDTTRNDAESGRRVRILLNDRGQLSEKSVIAVNLNPVSGMMASGDFNNDRRDDFVVVEGSARVFMSNGDGTFAATQLGGTDVRFASTRDLDGDGIDDLVYGGKSFDGKGELSIRLGSASGLGAERTVAMPRAGHFVAVGDFDGNGIRDIVANAANNAPDILLDAADPARAHVRTFVADTSMRSPVVADVNDDGRDDLTEHHFGVGVQPFLGTATGSFSGADSYFVPRLSGNVFGPHDTDAADIDRDGDPDLAVVTEDGFAILINDGRGIFRSVTFSTFARAVADFNNDGRDDVVDHTGVFLADANGRITRNNDPFPIPPYVDFLAADMNGDGNMDVVAFASDGRVRVRLGNGDGTLGSNKDTTLGGSYNDVAIADFNGDGKLDVLKIARSTVTYIFGWGDGAGGFSSKTETFVDPFIHDVAAGDLDNDGDVDLVLTTANKELTLLVAYNNGSGTFSTPIGIGQVNEGIALGDVNADGRLDVVTAGVNVYLNLGAGTFSKRGPYLAKAPGAFGDLHVRDFNRDGYADVLVTEPATTEAEGWAALFLADGLGGLGPEIAFRAIAAGDALTGDFNGDGKFDFLDAGFPRLNLCTDFGPRRRSARH